MACCKPCMRVRRFRDSDRTPVPGVLLLPVRGYPATGPVLGVIRAEFINVLRVLKRSPTTVVLQGARSQSVVKVLDRSKHNNGTKRLVQSGCEKEFSQLGKVDHKLHVRSSMPTSSRASRSRRTAAASEEQENMKGAHGENGEHAERSAAQLLDDASAELQTLMAKPTVLLLPQDQHRKAVLKASEMLYSFSGSAGLSDQGQALPALITEGCDAEQIWGQLQMKEGGMRNRLNRKIKGLLAQPTCTLLREAKRSRKQVAVED
eukprot:1349853-Rhodomonas_salina.1